MNKRLRAWLHHLGYTLSLPERAVRSVIALAAGATKVVADAALPPALRRSRTYAALVGNAQRFMIEKIGDVEGAYEANSQSLPDDYVPRKVAGNVMEALGIFSVRLSPLWLFAIAADVADGGRTYLHRLTEQLRRDGLIEPNTEIKELDDVFAAMTRATESTARVFDTPPLSIKDIKALRDQIVGGYKGVFSEVTDLLPRIDRLWAQMHALAGAEGLSRLAGVMTVDLNKAAGSALDRVFCVGRATTELLGEQILDSYGQSLIRVQQQGLVACVDEATRPYLRAFVKQYNRSRLSWTQRAIHWLAGLLRRSGSSRGSSAQSAATALPATPTTTENAAPHGPTSA